MTASSLILIGISIYAVIMIFIGLVSSKNHDEDAFIIGNRNLNLFQMAASTGAEFRDAAFVAFWITFEENLSNTIIPTCVMLFLSFSTIFIGLIRQKRSL